MTCPRCAATTALDDRFCGACGFDQHRTTEPPSTGATRRIETGTRTTIVGGLITAVLVAAALVLWLRDERNDTPPDAAATTTVAPDDQDPTTTVPTTTVPAGVFPDVFDAAVVDGLDLVVWLDSAMYVIDLDDLSAEVIGPGTEFVSEVSVFETVADRIVVIDDSLTNAILPGNKGEFVLLGRANRIFASDRGRVAWTVDFRGEGRAVAHELAGGEPLHEIPLVPGTRIRGAFGDGLVISTSSGTFVVGPDESRLFTPHEVLAVADPWLAVSRCSADLLCEIVIQNALTGAEWVARTSTDGDDVAATGAVEVSPTGDAAIFLQSGGSEVVRSDGQTFALPDIGTQRPRWSLDGAWITNRDSERILFFAADGSGSYEFRFSTHGYGDDMPFNLNEAYTLICDVEEIDTCA